MAYPIDEIIAIDPGETTGFAHLRVTSTDDGCIFKPVILREIEWNEHWSYLHDLFTYLKNIHERKYATVVVVENFRLFAHEVTHQINSDFPSSQIIGVCKYICAMTTTELVLQMASVKRQFPSNELRKWLPPNILLPTSLHIRDAISHAMYLYFDRRLK